MMSNPDSILFNHIRLRGRPAQDDGTGERKYATNDKLHVWLDKRLEDWDVRLRESPGAGVPKPGADVEPGMARRASSTASLPSKSWSIASTSCEPMLSAIVFFVVGIPVCTGVIYIGRLCEAKILRKIQQESQRREIVNAGEIHFERSAGTHRPK